MAMLIFTCRRIQRPDEEELLVSAIRQMGSTVPGGFTEKPSVGLLSDEPTTLITIWFDCEQSDFEKAQSDFEKAQVECHEILRQAGLLKES